MVTRSDESSVSAEMVTNIRKAKRVCYRIVPKC